MSRRVAVLAVCLVLAMPAFAASPAAGHDAPNRCGRKHAPGAGWWKARGHNVGCEKTRRVARRWENKCIFEGNCPRRGAVTIHVRPGFRCRDKQAGHESVKVRCTAEGGDRIVHFFWGS